MDWFERLTGFREEAYEATRSRLQVIGDSLHSKVNGRHYGIGRFELVSLASLRERVRAVRHEPGRLRVGIVQGEVRRLHQRPEFHGALFQVASQFNMLEMVGPTVTPEDGVTRYQGDPTQGPACAMAAGAATLYRNYFVPVGEQTGQTRAHQLDGLADLAAALAGQTGRPVEALLTMQNGYALCSQAGLDAIAQHLAALDPEALDARRGVSNVVLLTRLGGGAFGNDDEWIDAAMRRALRLASGFDLDVRLVSHGRSPHEAG